MELSLFGKLSYSSTQKILSILWKSKIHYCVHNIPPLATSWAGLNYSIPSQNFLKINFNIIFHLLISLYSCLLPTKILYEFIFFLLYVTHPVHLILSMTILIRPPGSKNYEAPQYEMFSSLLAPNTVLSTLLSNILSLCSSVNVSHQDSYSYKTTGKIKKALLKKLKCWHSTSQRSQLKQFVFTIWKITMYYGYKHMLNTKRNIHTAAKKEERQISSEWKLSAPFWVLCTSYEMLGFGLAKRAWRRRRHRIVSLKNKL
jgi:hypothetical protein